MASQYSFTPSSRDSICRLVLDETEHFQHLILISTLSLVCVHIVSLGKAVLPHIQLKVEDRARLNKLPTWRGSTQMPSAVLSPPEPNQHDLSLKVYTTNGRTVCFGRCTFKECLSKIRQQPAKLSFSYYRLGTDWLGIRSVAKDLGVLEDSKLNMGQQRAVTASQTVIRRCIASRLKEVVLSQIGTY